MVRLPDLLRTLQPAPPPQWIEKGEVRLYSETWSVWHQHCQPPLGFVYGSWFMVSVQALQIRGMGLNYPSKNVWQNTGSWHRFRLLAPQKCLIFPFKFMVLAILSIYLYLYTQISTYKYINVFLRFAIERT